MFSSLSWADCNIDLAKASGEYLAELEKAELRSYQNNSVCAVLDQELASCSKGQLAKLKKSFNIKEVHRNYCQPHLPPYPVTNKKEFFKGVELYSWKEHEGYYWYAILPGTNRLKTTKELLANKLSHSYLKAKLRQLPPNAEISWNNLTKVDDKQNLRFSRPSESVVKDIKTYISKSKLVLSESVR